MESRSARWPRGAIDDPSPGNTNASMREWPEKACPNCQVATDAEKKRDRLTIELSRAEGVGLNEWLGER